MNRTDEQPFLEAIFDRYEDDRPRLIYADFLDDAGQPERAELIRVQIALAHLDDNDPRRSFLLDRQAELLHHNRNVWIQPLARWVVGIDFRRGIPDSVTVHATTFLHHGSELMQRLPIRRLRLLEVNPVIDKLFCCPLLAQLRELDVCGAELGDAGVQRLAQCAHWKQLTTLDLGFNGLSDQGVVALARSASMPQLATLALNDNDQITSDGLEALANSATFAALRHLDVSGNDIDERGLAAVVASPVMARLQSLRCNANRIGDAGIAVLTSSHLLARWLAVEKALVLRDNAIGPAGAQQLAYCPALAQCRTLDLSNNYLGDAGIAALLRSPYLTRLKVMRLARNQLTDNGVAAVHEPLQRLLDQLTLLDVSHNRLTRLGLALLDILKGQRPVQLERADNVQAAPAGDAPVAVAELLPDVMASVTDAARLKHRIAHPRNASDRL
ncbi:MAG: TIGR02996 domain-containing protein [Gemmataceae bacterium]|nr:TIGR02996 domain-containing protein [Gemmata sp.]MDW8196119.1 TIGR02996 domain-containing protein [Gemmataceae bacterium]